MGRVVLGAAVGGLAGLSRAVVAKVGWTAAIVVGGLVVLIVLALMLVVLLLFIPLMILFAGLLFVPFRWPIYRLHQMVYILRHPSVAPTPPPRLRLWTRRRLDTVGAEPDVGELVEMARKQQTRYPCLEMCCGTNCETMSTARRPVDHSR